MLGRIRIYRPLNQNNVEVKKANNRMKSIEKKERKIIKGSPKPKTQAKIKTHLNSKISINKDRVQSVNIFLYSYPFMQRYRSNSYYRPTL